MSREKIDTSDEDFGYESVIPTRRGLTLTRSVYIALLIVFAFALVRAAWENTFISHVLIVNITGNAGLQAFTSGPTSMPLSQFSGGEYPGSLLVTIISVMITWPLIAWGLNQISGAFFGGTGKFYPDMLAGIGFTYLVKVAAGIIAVLLISQMPLYEIDYLQISSNSDTALNYVNSILNSSPYYQLEYYLRWAGLVLSCCYGVAIVKKVEKIKLWQAALVVGVPLLVYIILNYLGFFDLL